jgi:hypothetical protein
MVWHVLGRHAKFCLHSSCYFCHGFNNCDTRSKNGVEGNRNSQGYAKREGSRNKQYSYKRIELRTSGLLLCLVLALYPFIWRYEFQLCVWSVADGRVIGQGMLDLVSPMCNASQLTSRWRRPGMKRDLQAWMYD